MSCPHGSDILRYDGQVWAAPFGECGCCGIWYPFPSGNGVCWECGGVPYERPKLTPNPEYPPKIDMKARPRSKLP